MAQLTKAEAIDRLDSLALDILNAVNDMFKLVTSCRSLGFDRADAERLRGISQTLKDTKPHFDLLRDELDYLIRGINT